MFTYWYRVLSRFNQISKLVSLGFHNTEDVVWAPCWYCLHRLSTRCLDGQSCWRRWSRSWTCSSRWSARCAARSWRWSSRRCWSSSSTVPKPPVWWSSRTCWSSASVWSSSPPAPTPASPRSPRSSRSPPNKSIDVQSSARVTTCVCVCVCVCVWTYACVCVWVSEFVFVLSFFSRLAMDSVM